MEVKGFSAFLKAPALLKPHHQIVISEHLVGESYPFKEMLSMSSAVPADWAIVIHCFCILVVHAENSK